MPQQMNVFMGTGIGCVTLLVATLFASCFVVKPASFACSSTLLALLRLPGAPWEADR